MSEQPVTPALQRRLTGTLFISESLFSASVIASFTLMPIVAQELTGRDSLAGIPSTMMLIGQAAAAYPLGRLMDRFGRRTGLSIGYFIAAAGAVLATLAIGWGAFVGFIFGTFLYGVGRAGGLQARFAAAEIRPTAQRAKAIGLLVFAGTVGAVGGPLLAGPSTEWALRAGFNEQIGPFVVAAAFFYLAFLLTFIFLRPDPMRVGQAVAAAEDAAAGTAGRPAREPRSVRAIFATQPVQLALASMMIGQLVMTLIMVITPLYMKQLGYATEQISWVIMAHTLGMFAFSSGTGWLIDRVGRVRMIVAGGVLLVVSAVMAPLSTALVPLMAALFLLGLGWNFCFIAGSSLLSDSLAANERGRTQGTNDMLVALASGTGSLSTGTIFGLGGMALVSNVGLVIAGGLLLFAYWATRRHAPVPAAGD